MKFIYTNENRFIVNNIRNILQNNGIETLLKNEFISGATGDLSPFDTWLELWIEHDKDFDQALSLIEDLEKDDSSKTWVCQNCHEVNPASFDICWNCQKEKQT